MYCLSINTSSLVGSRVKNIDENWTLSCYGCVECEDLPRYQCNRSVGRNWCCKNDGLAQSINQAEYDTILSSI
jgi:hypothetical protein